MATSEAEKRANGNFLSGLRAQMNGVNLELQPRRGNLPIFVVSTVLLLDRVSAIPGAKESWLSVIGSPDLHTQPTFHRDDAGFLPEAPPDTGLPELHIPGNGLPYPGMLRLVVDLPGQRLFITPTHYEQWNDGSSPRNPFYVLHNPPVLPEFGPQWDGLLPASG